MVRPEWFLFLNSLIGAFVSSVAVTGANGIGVSGSPVTSSGTIALSLGAITPTSVAATGTVAGSNLSGTNTGDQTISLTGLVSGSGVGAIATALNLAQITNSLGADVALNNTANYFDGPSVAQGTVGTWFVSGKVTLNDTAAANMFVKLWDGTTVIDSGVVLVDSLDAYRTMTLCGIITSPAGNLRISAKDTTTANGKIIFNQSGNSKDSTITAFRIA